MASMARMGQMQDIHQTCRGRRKHGRWCGWGGKPMKSRDGPLISLHHTAECGDAVEGWQAAPRRVSIPKQTVSTVRLSGDSCVRVSIPAVEVSSLSLPLHPTKPDSTAYLPIIPTLEMGPDMYRRTLTTILLELQSSAEVDLSVPVEAASPRNTRTVVCLEG